MSSGKHANYAYISSSYGSGVNNMQRGTGQMAAEDIMRRRAQDLAAAAAPAAQAPAYDLGASQAIQPRGDFAGAENGEYDASGAGQDELDETEIDPVVAELSQQLHELDYAGQEQAQRLQEEEAYKMQTMVDDRTAAVAQLRRDGIFDQVPHAIEHVKSAPGVITLRFEARFRGPVGLSDITEDDKLQLHGSAICAPVVPLGPHADHSHYHRSGVYITGISAPNVAGLDKINLAEAKMSLISVMVNAKSPSKLRDYVVFLKKTQHVETGGTPILKINGSTDINRKGTRSVIGHTSERAGGGGAMYYNLDAVAVANEGMLANQEYGDSLADNELAFWQTIQNIIDDNQIVKCFDSPTGEKAYAMHTRHKDWRAEDFEKLNHDFNTLLRAFNITVPESGRIGSESVARATTLGYIALPSDHWDLFVNVVRKRAALSTVSNQVPFHQSQVHDLSGTVAELLEMCAIPSELALEYAHSTDKLTLAKKYYALLESFPKKLRDNLLNTVDEFSLCGEATFAIHPK